MCIYRYVCDGCETLTALNEKAFTAKSHSNYT